MYELGPFKALLYGLGILRCQVIGRGTVELHFHGRRRRVKVYLVTPHKVAYHLTFEEAEQIILNAWEWQEAVSIVRASQ